MILQCLVLWIWVEIIRRSPARWVISQNSFYCKDRNLFVSQIDGFPSVDGKVTTRSLRRILIKAKPGIKFLNRNQSIRNSVLQWLIVSCGGRDTVVSDRRMIMMMNVFQNWGRQEKIILINNLKWKRWAHRKEGRFSFIYQLVQTLTARFFHTFETKLYWKKK